MITQDIFVYPRQFWVAAFMLFLGMIILDLRLHKREGKMPALIMTVAGVIASMCWMGAIYIYGGAEDGVAFLTGYLLELTLSIDNIFVFMLIFSSFNIIREHQHRILFIGIISAIVMRLAMIVYGLELLTKFQWLFYIFAAIMVAAAYKMFSSREGKDAPTAEGQKSSGVLRFVTRFMDISRDNQHFFVKKNGKWIPTYAFISLLLIEKADLIFAFDSVPAVLAVTRNPFIVFTSNVCAIMGLRSMYQVISEYVGKMRYINQGVGVILLLIAVKMVLVPAGVHVPPIMSLLCVVSTLALVIVMSLLQPNRRI